MGDNTPTSGIRKRTIGKPKFYLDKDWDVHYGDWFVMAKKFRLSDASLKDCLYWSIQDGAKKLIYTDFLPDKQQNRALSAQEYPQKLKEVFLPLGESDAARALICTSTPRKESLKLQISRGNEGLGLKQHLISNI